MNESAWMLDGRRLVISTALLFLVCSRVMPALADDSEECTRGDNDACRRMAEELVDKGDFDKALEYAETGCERGDGDSCATSSTVHAMKNNMQAALHFAVRGCQLKSGIACGFASGMHYESGAIDDCLTVAVVGCGLKDGQACRFASFAFAARGERETAFRYAASACELNEGYACANHAQWLAESGDLDGALHSAQRGCLHDSALACGVASALLLKKGDQQSAGVLLTKACRLGDSRSCTMLGALQAMREDLAEAWVLATQSCDQNDAMSCNLVAAILIEKGDLDGAYPWAIKGCELLSGQACGQVAALLAIRGDFETALKYAVNGCELRCGLACGNAGYILWKAGKVSEALSYVMQGCQLNSGHACGTAGGLFEERGDSERALLYTTKGCEHGDGQSCANAALLYTAVGSKDGSLQYSREGCKRRNGKACGILAEHLHKDGDINNARLNALDGCEYGDDYACKIVANMALESPNDYEFKAQALSVSPIRYVNGGRWRELNIECRSESAIYEVLDRFLGPLSFNYDPLVDKAMIFRDAACMVAACRVDTARVCSDTAEHLLIRQQITDASTSALALHHRARRYLRSEAGEAQGVVVAGYDPAADLEQAVRLYGEAGLGALASAARLDLGYALWLAGRAEEALAVFSAPPSLTTAMVPAADSEHQATLRRRVGLLAPTPVWSAGIGIGMSLARLKREPEKGLVFCGQGGGVWGDACRALNYINLGASERAAEAFGAALQAINGHLDFLSENEAARQAAAEAYGVVLEAYLRFLLSGGISLDEAGRRALVAVEVFKARGFQTEWVLQQAAYSVGAEKEYRAYLDARGRLMARKGQTDLIAAQLDRDARKEFEAAAAALRQRLGRAADFQVPDDLVERLCARLPAGGVVLDWAPLGYPRLERLVVAGLRKAVKGGTCEARVWEAGSVTELDLEGDSLLGRSLLGGPTDYARHGESGYERLLRRRRTDLKDEEWLALGSKLFGGAAGWVDSAGGVVAVAPWGPLERVNFEYLKGAWNGGRVRPLKEHRPVVRLASAAAMARMESVAAKAGKRTGVLAYVAPAFSATAEELGQARSSGEEASRVAADGLAVQLRHAALAGGDRCSGGFGSLPANDPFGDVKGFEPTVRERLKAGERELRADLATGQWQAVHLYTHGLLKEPECVRVSGPEAEYFRSMLALAGANELPKGEDRDPNDDGELTAAEVLGLPFGGIDLVTLAACESGAGSQAGLEGQLGFPRALIQAGVRHVLAALRSVPAGETDAIVRGFYRHYFGGRPPREALDEARREYGQAHPEVPNPGMDFVVVQVAP